MKKEKNRSLKVLNVSLILFSFIYCFLFYKYWLLMIPLFIVGTLGDYDAMIINTSVIYFFCLFTNWLNIFLLSLSFVFYLLINRIIDILAPNGNYNFIISSIFVSVSLMSLDNSNFSDISKYVVFSVSLVLLSDCLFKKFYLLNLKKYFLEIVSIQLSGDKKVNGDYFDVLEHEGCQYLMLSDGLGQGKQANKISKNSVTNVKEKILDGMKMKDAVNIVNKDLINKKTFASFDFVRCKHNKIKFYKYGAETSYILHNRSIKELGKHNLPLGIKDKKVRASEERIYDQDILLMCSDGVINSYPYFFEELYNKKEETELINWVENTALNLKGKLKDDFSIILVKFNEKRDLM